MYTDGASVHFIEHRELGFVLQLCVNGLLIISKSIASVASKYHKEHPKLENFINFTWIPMHV